MHGHHLTVSSTIVTFLSNKYVSCSTCFVIYMPKKCLIFLYWNNISIIIIWLWWLFIRLVFGAPSALGALRPARDACGGRGSAVDEVNMYLQVLTYQTWEKKHPPGSQWDESRWSSDFCCSYSHLCSFNKPHRDTHTAAAAAAAAVSTPQPKAEQTHHHVECDHGASLIQIRWAVKWNRDGFTANTSPSIQGGVLDYLKWFGLWKHIFG